MRKTALIAVLLILTWPAAVHAASKAGPCGIRFESLSRISGLPGNIVKMYGKWGQSQNERIACMNKGGMNKLEIISWSDSVIEAKIPQDLVPGKYKAGIYCNDPSKGGSFASRWLDFEILSVETGSQPEKQPGGIVNDHVSPAAGGRSKSAVRKTLKRTDAGPLCAVTDKKWTIIGIIAIAVVILLIRRFSETRMTMPSAYDAKKQYLGKTGLRAIGQTARHNGEEYYISVSTDRVFTIEISPSFPLLKKFEVNARAGLPPAADAGWGEDVKALLSLGVNYIDVGVNGPRVAAELPFKSSVETGVVEKIVEHLVRLRDFSR